MQQYFINEELELNQLYRVNKEQEHHILKVLRMKDGDVVRVVSKGKLMLANVKSQNKELYFSTFKQLFEDHELPVEINLFVALIKNDKFDFMLQKVTELGVTRIIPIESKRCVVKLKDPAKKVSRWSKICLEASEQCKRVFVPQVLKPIKLKEIEVVENDLNVVAYEDLENNIEFKKLITTDKNINIIIGPEGGFDDAEISLLKDKGFTVARLGKRILRAETASIVAISTVSCILE